MDLSPPPALTIGPVTRTDFVRYQGASGDMQPIHHDEPFATEAGHPAPLGIGMFHAGVMTTWATDWLGPANVRRTRIRFKAPVYPGDTLSFSGTVLETSPNDDGTTTVKLELSGVREGDGATVVQGWMDFALP
jgi:acyl dehydratase